MTGLLISRSNTGEKVWRILPEGDGFLTFFLPIYFVHGNKFSAYISIHRGLILVGLSVPARNSNFWKFRRRHKDVPGIDSEVALLVR